MPYTDRTQTSLFSCRRNINFCLIRTLNRQKLHFFHGNLLNLPIKSRRKFCFNVLPKQMFLIWHFLIFYDKKNLKIKTWHQFSIFDFKRKLNGRMTHGPPIQSSGSRLFPPHSFHLRLPWYFFRKGRGKCSCAAVAWKWLNYLIVFWWFFGIFYAPI